MSILDLLQHIVNEPAPRLTPEERFPKMAHDFIDGCLSKDPDQRKTPKELLVCFFRPYNAHSTLMRTRNPNGLSTRARQTSTSRRGRAPFEQALVSAPWTSIDVDTLFFYLRAPAFFRRLYLRTLFHPLRDTHPPGCACLKNHLKNLLYSRTHTAEYFTSCTRNIAA